MLVSEHPCHHARSHSSACRETNSCDRVPLVVKPVPGARRPRDHLTSTVTPPDLDSVRAFLSIESTEDRAPQSGPWISQDPLPQAFSYSVSPNTGCRSYEPIQKAIPDGREAPRATSLREDTNPPKPSSAHAPRPPREGLRITTASDTGTSTPPRCY